jgi:uncharacterized membrane protein
MPQGGSQLATYVIKATELPALTSLAQGFPHPLSVEWINRGTDQKLRPSTVDMLIRTLSHDDISPSVDRLQMETGLRLIFANERDRNLFAAMFTAARARENLANPSLITATFVKRSAGDHAIAELIGAGVSEHAILMLRRAQDSRDADEIYRAGHSKLSVALATAGGGIAGTVLGVAILAVPAIGPIVVTSALVHSIASIGGIAGATGGAIAKMLTDLDVDSADAAHIENQIRHGKVYLSVDMRKARAERGLVRRVLLKHDGHLLSDGRSNLTSHRGNSIAASISNLCHI